MTKQYGSGWDKADELEIANEIMQKEVERLTAELAEARARVAAPEWINRVEVQFYTVTQRSDKRFEMSNWCVGRGTTVEEAVADAITPTPDPEDDQ